MNAVYDYSGDVGAEERNSDGLGCRVLSWFPRVIARSLAPRGWPSAGIPGVELKPFHVQILLRPFDFLSSEFLELMLCSCLKHCLRVMGK